MDKLIFSFSALCSLVLLFSSARAGQSGGFRNLRGGSEGPINPPRLVERAGTPQLLHPHPGFQIPGNGAFVRSVPTHHFRSTRVVITHPFFCFSDGAGFVSRHLFADHLRHLHGIAFENVPRVIVQDRSRAFFLPRHRFGAARIVVLDPFFCFPHDIAFVTEAAFFDHLHSAHGFDFELIPEVLVQSGAQIFFLGF